MRMLADSKSMSFDDIKYDILYSVSKGSVIEDYIGFSADETEGYNFDFIEQAEKLVLKVGDIVIFSRYGGNDLKYKGVGYTIINQKDILATIEK